MRFGSWDAPTRIATGDAYATQPGQTPSRLDLTHRVRIPVAPITEHGFFSVVTASPGWDFAGKQAYSCGCVIASPEDGEIDTLYKVDMVARSYHSDIIALPYFGFTDGVRGLNSAAAGNLLHRDWMLPHDSENVSNGHVMRCNDVFAMRKRDDDALGDHLIFFIAFENVNASARNDVFVKATGSVRRYSDEAAYVDPYRH